jgi:thiol-disulfide isomerase/thioredoxin
VTNSYSVIPPGIWRATLELTADSADLADERSGGILPFNFEVQYITEDSFHFIIRNGEERIVCSDIQYGLNRRTGRDTIKIFIPALGTYITGEYEEDALEGYWWDPNRSPDYRIRLKALHGRDHRFDVNEDVPFQNFEGRWKAVLSVETPEPEDAVLVVKQDGNHCTGTIMTETGDYRYLEGNASEDRLFLSTFDGSHAYLFEAKQIADGSLSGVFRSGNHYKTYWSAVRNDTVELGNPYSLTSLRDSSAIVGFRLPNLNGDTISLNDPQYQGKPKLITIFGSWCPNCLDENTFLSDYMKKNPNTGFEIISIAFERQADKEKALQQLRNYKEHFNIPWEILYGGASKKEHVTATLPFLEEFLSFPTMIFLDRNNRVLEIHTGFYGPATDKYDEFVKEFEHSVRDLSATN